MNIKFFEFEKTYIAFVWITAKHITGSYPGILIIKKHPNLNIEKLTQKSLSQFEYFLSLNINGVRRVLNIKNVKNLYNRNTSNIKHDINVYNEYIKNLDKEKKVEFINEGFLFNR